MTDPEDSELEAAPDRPIPLEADPADVVEQTLEAGDDDEDHRDA